MTVDPSNPEFRVEIATYHSVSSIKVRTESFVPASAGLGPDTRQLGVFIKAVLLHGE